METRTWMYLTRNSVLVVFSLISCFLASSEAEIYSWCEIAHLFQQNGLDGYRGYQLADWVCLAYYASGFNTAASDYEADRNSNNGIFHINIRCWCNDCHTPLINKCKIHCNDTNPDSAHWPSFRISPFLGLSLCPSFNFI